MSARQFATRWFARPEISQRAALLWCIVAIAVPTLLRGLVDGQVSGSAFLPYIPFVLLTAIFLPWPFAAAVALISAVVADELFAGTPYKILGNRTELFGVLAFLAGSAVIITFVHMARRLVQDYGRLTDEHMAHSGIVFSLENGQAWASWYGPGSRVCLGPEEEVAEMMKDFLAQLELGKRLPGNRRRPEVSEPASPDS